MPRATSVLAVLLVSACSFDQSGIAPVSDAGNNQIVDGGAPSDSRVTIDATPGLDACVPGCVGDQLHSCDPPSTQTCALGCAPDNATCQAIAPSNGVDLDQLSGVTQGLVLAAEATTVIDSDTGEIVTGMTIVRGPGGGVISGVRFEQLSNSIAVLGVAGLSVGQDAYVRVIGSRALIILSAGNVTINGTIDVSGGCMGAGSTCAGPGAGNGTPDEAIAATGCAPGGNGGGGSGLPPETGGGGGGFGGAGAPGGSDGSSDPGGVGGTLPGMCSGATLIPLMGGGGGGAGGIDDCGGDGGGGGGGLQITSYTRIDIIGPGTMGRLVGIVAAGAGGRGGEASDGGGGGGAGGGILLEAVAINVSDAVLAANGGAGGGGGNNPNGATGQSGTFGSAQAVGGDDTRRGGLGGSSEGAATTGEGGGDNTGGGGGGVGIIRLNVTQTGLSLNANVIVSPAFTRGDPGVN